jgi:hypothetical protein
MYLADKAGDSDRHAKNLCMDALRASIIIGKLVGLYDTARRTVLGFMKAQNSK